VSHRFVYAPSRGDAEREVMNSIMAALDIRATPAGAALTSAFEKSGPIRQKGLLARLDGLRNPRERESARSARRRLARLIRYDLQERAWLLAQAKASPPISPAALEQLIRLREVAHVERQFTRLPEWDRQSPIHGQ
jgi:hypothetical protein